MINIDNINTALAPIISKQPQLDADGNFELVDCINLDEYMYVSTNMFLNLFANAIDMTANSLLLIDAGKMGYGDYIDSWKGKGYIQ